MGRILGIDYGEKRIGFAISDELKVVASPLLVHSRKKKGDDLSAVIHLCSERYVERIVIGQPLNMDGSSGSAVEKVEDFVERLRMETSIDIDLWDERMSTMSAERVLLEGDVSRSKRKTVVDKLAAQIILQSYLDAL